MRTQVLVAVALTAATSLTACTSSSNLPTSDSLSSFGSVDELHQAFLDAGGDCDPAGEVAVEDFRVMSCNEGAPLILLFPSADERDDFLRSGFGEYEPNDYLDGIVGQNWAILSDDDVSTYAAELAGEEWTRG